MSLKFPRFSPLFFAVCVGLLMAMTTMTASAQVKGLPDFTELVEQSAPTVVNIRTKEKVPVRQPGGQGPGGIPSDMCEMMRGMGFPIQCPPSGSEGRNAPQPRQPQEIEVNRGVGSGFLISSDGYILTNAHVVEGASEVLVTMTDKREFKARIIGADKRSDVAVVKIDATDLPFAKMGDPAKLRAGEWVLAIGSPYGLENSVTAGIVSARVRETGELLPSIQSDVAVNPGNSGGPLINMRGEVVGINSQIVTRSGASAGVTLSIPINEAMKVADQLKRTGRVARGRMGIAPKALSKEIAQSLGLPAEKGVAVEGVVENSPAAKAGIRVGDIIIRVNGTEVLSDVELPRLVGSYKPGTKITVTILRNGKAQDVPVTLEDFEPETIKKNAKAGESDKPSHQAATRARGLVVRELSEAQKQALGGANAAKGGVLVEEVDGQALKAGLKGGDIILSVGHTSVASVEQLEQAMAKSDADKAVAVFALRGARGAYVLLEPESKKQK